MSNCELSFISDELKPRRTPEPFAFKETLPRPLVPDLSIIESSPVVDPEGRGRTRGQACLGNQSYNEWRRKTGFVHERLKSSRPEPLINRFSQQPLTRPPIKSNPSCDSALSQEKRIVLDCVTDAVQRYGLSDSAPSLGRHASYSDFKRRPSSAPVERSQSTFKHLQSQTSSTTTCVRDNVNSNPNPYFSRNSQVVRTPHQLSNDKYCNSGSVQFHDMGNGQTARPPNQPFQHTSTYDGHCMVYPEAGVPSISKLGIEAQSRCNLSKAAPYLHDRDDGHPHSLSGVQHHICSGFATPDMNSCHVKHSCCQSYERPCCSSYSPTVAPEAIAPTQMNEDPYVKHTYNDLYRIILAQNNELKGLQAQVEKLMINQYHNKCSTHQESSCCSKQLITKALPPPAPDNSHAENLHVSEEGTQTSDVETKTDRSQKMSIGVMTSFIHAVAYSGRIDLGGVHEHQQVADDQEQHSSQSDSEDYESTSRSPLDHRSCKRIISKKKKKCIRSLPTNAKLSTKDSNAKDFGFVDGPATGKGVSAAMKKGNQSNSVCSQAGSCNNPGVSAAINAVRGCQAVLASNTGINLDESLTFNAGDMPAVTEQSVSPMSSIHVDLQDYHESNSEGSDFSESEREFDSEKEESSCEEDSGQPSGWKNRYNVMYQLNKILAEKHNQDRPSAGCFKGNKTVLGVKSREQVSPLSKLKGTNVATSKRVAFEGAADNNNAQNLKDLALKYLKENYPEELSPCPQPVGGIFHTGENTQEMTVYNTPGANMSFATFRYLERYDLLPENFNPQQYLETTLNVHGFNRKTITDAIGQEGVYNRPSRLPGEGRSKNPQIVKTKSRSKSHQLRMTHHHEATNKGHRKTSPKYHEQVPFPVSKHLQGNAPPSKILDITALRQQSKLL